MTPGAQGATGRRRARGHRARARPRFAPPLTETTPLAPSTAEAAVAMERLAAWVIGGLTALVIGGLAPVIYVPHGGHAGGASWLPQIKRPLNATAAGPLGTAD